MPKTLSRMEVADILDELASGMSVTKVALAHGTNQARIRAIRDARGEAEIMTTAVSTLTAEDKKVIKHMYLNDNMTVAQIIDELQIKDVWGVMQYCESSVFDNKRVKDNKTAILRKYWNGWEVDEIAEYYNVHPSTIAKITTPAREKAILRDYKDGVSIADLLDMYSLTLESLQSILCKRVRAEIKGAI